MAPGGDGDRADGAGERGAPGPRGSSCADSARISWPPRAMALGSLRWQAARAAGLALAVVHRCRGPWSRRPCRGRRPAGAIGASHVAWAATRASRLCGRRDRLRGPARDRGIGCAHERAAAGCGRGNGATTSATRCPGTGPASTGSSCGARPTCAGRCTGTCSRRCARGGWRSAPTRCSSRTSGSPRRAPARVRIGEGSFLNIGVMVAALDLVEIGSHCMFANGCIVTDANHRYDDPGRPITWQGFDSQGTHARRRQHVVRRERRHHQRRDRGRALRDRRQQRRHRRPAAALDRGRRPGAGDQAGGVLVSPRARASLSDGVASR